MHISETERTIIPVLVAGIFQILGHALARRRDSAKQNLTEPQRQCFLNGLIIGALFVLILAVFFCPYRQAV